MHLHIAFSHCSLISAIGRTKAESYTSDSNSRKISKGPRARLFAKQRNRNTINNHFLSLVKLRDKWSRNVLESHRKFPYSRTSFKPTAEIGDGNEGSSGATRYSRDPEEDDSVRRSLEFRRNSSWHNIRLGCCSNRISS